MISTSILFIISVVIIYYITYVASQTVNNDDPHQTKANFVAKLHGASTVTENAIHGLYEEWQINKYPAFLKSCHMHRSAWEIMKLKFMYNILYVEETKQNKDFVISFLGSSVAAGHDSLFNESYPIQVEYIMKESFGSVGMKLISRNVALGNNPCVPYDLCVKTFAGLDADIVQWEQSYNCPNNAHVMEQFIRQSMLIPSKPIVVFSESSTATWDSKDCDKKEAKVGVTEQEGQLLKAPSLLLVSELTKDEYKRAFHSLHDLTRLYGAAGIQTFMHNSHGPYACQGPYIPKWQEGAARWHPSVKSHRLRASQHSYFWLSAFRDAIDDILAGLASRSVDAMTKEVVRKIHGFYYHSEKHGRDVVHRHHLDTIHKNETAPSSLSAVRRRLEENVDIDHLLKKIKEEKLTLPIHVYPPIAQDNMQCYTDYEPRSMREASLAGRVIDGMASSATTAGWKSIIYENLVDEKIVKKSLSRGYLDYKHLLYGNKDDGPISFAVTPATTGNVMICETPGIWGSLPKGFYHIWDTNTEIYLSPAAPTATKFTFNSAIAKKLDFIYKKQLDICMESTSPIEVGNHVLTVVPRNESRIIVAWLLIP